MFTFPRLHLVQQYHVYLEVFSIVKPQHLPPYTHIGASEHKALEIPIVPGETRQ